MKKLLLLFALSSLASCADAGLRRVSGTLRAGGLARASRAPLRIQTPAGWDVELTSAELGLGAVYLYNAAPGVGTSDDEGRVVAQCLARGTVDALDPALREFSAPLDAVTEPALSARVVLLEPTEGAIADAAGAGVAVAHLAGTASRAGVTVRFAGGFALPLDGSLPAWQWAELHQLRRLPLQRTLAQGDAVELRVDPSHWLDAVDFSSLPGAASVASFDSSDARAQLRAGILGARSGLSLR